MRSWLPTLRSLGLALSVTLACGLAHAQVRDTPRAQKLFEEARALIKQGKYEAACPKLADSQTLDPAPGTLLNLADCEENINRWLSARKHWRELLQALPVTGDERRTLAQQRLDALQKKIPQLTLWLAPGAPPSTRVLRDGAELAPTSFGVADEVDPGMHEVLVRLQGYQDRKYLIAVQPSQHLDQVVEPGIPALTAPPPQSAAPLPTATMPYPPHPPPPYLRVEPTAPQLPPPVQPPVASASASAKESSTVHKLGHWGIGLGAATLGVGTLLGGLVLLKKVSLSDSCPDNHCPPDQRDNYDTATTMAGWSTGLFVVGGIVLATGIVLVSLPDKGKEAKPLPKNDKGVVNHCPSLAVRASPLHFSLEGRF